MTSTDTRPTSTTLTARCPEDLLAVVPVVLGFTPTDSVVMLTFGAEHAFHARVDLPERAVDVAALADVLLDPADHHGVESVVLLVYSDDPLLAATTWRRLREGCRRRRIRVVEALRTDGARWYPLRGHDPATRRDGVAYDVASHPFAAQAVLDGRVAHRSRSELAATLEALPDGVARVQACVDALDPRSALDSRPAVLAEGAWVQGLLERHVDDATSPTDPEVARLLRDVGLISLRDAAWAVLDRPRARSFVALWTDVVRRSPAALLPPAAVLLGWSAWQAGEGALAWCAIDRCVEVDPDYSLMLLLGDALTRAVPPSAWTDGFDWTLSIPGSSPPSGREG